MIFCSTVTVYFLINCTFYFNFYLYMVTVIFMQISNLRLPDDIQSIPGRKNENNPV